MGVAKVGPGLDWVRAQQPTRGVPENMIIIVTIIITVSGDLTMDME